MLRELEYQALIQINFANRLSSLSSRFNRDSSSKFKIDKKEFTEILSRTKYDFKNERQSFYVTVAANKFNYRLLFDKSGNSVLTYIHLMEGDEFINTGLSHYSFLLNYFNCENLSFNQNFGINSIDEFELYIEELISIFNDFKDSHIKLFLSTKSNDNQLMTNYRGRLS